MFFRAKITKEEALTIATDLISQYPLVKIDRELVVINHYFSWLVTKPKKGRSIRIIISKFDGKVKNHNLEIFV